VLEDDCLPGPDFFRFMHEMLRHFAGNPRIMMVSGDNFQPGPISDSSYYFSRWTHIWGWGTWRRAWQHYDDRITSWPDVSGTLFLDQSTDSPVEKRHWHQVFDQIWNGQIDTWDFSWMYACWLNKGLAVLPNFNLVTNIGFGAAATHTTDALSPLASLPCEDLGDLVHPAELVRDVQADRWTWENVFLPACKPVASSPRRRLLNRLWPFRKPWPVSVSNH
jgi:hypothetical protein